MRDVAFGLLKTRDALQTVLQEGLVGRIGFQMLTHKANARRTLMEDIAGVWRQITQD